MYTRNITLYPGPYFEAFSVDVNVVITKEGRYGEVGEEWDELARTGLGVRDLTRWNFPSFSSPYRPSFLIAVTLSQLTKKSIATTWNH